MRLHKLFPSLCMRHLEWDGQFLRCPVCDEILAFMYNGGDHLSVAVFQPYVNRVKTMLYHEEPGYIDAHVYRQLSREDRKALIDEKEYPILVGSIRDLSEDMRLSVEGRKQRKGITVRIGKS